MKFVLQAIDVRLKSCLNFTQVECIEDLRELQTADESWARRFFISVNDQGETSSAGAGLANALHEKH